MTKQNNTKPMSWLMINLILIVAALATGLLFGFIGTIFKLPSSLITGALPAVVGGLAAFLIVRRKAATARQNTDNNKN